MALIEDLKKKPNSFGDAAAVAANPAVQVVPTAGGVAPAAVAPAGVAPVPTAPLVAPPVAAPGLGLRGNSFGDAAAAANNGGVQQVATGAPAGLGVVRPAAQSGGAAFGVFPQMPQPRPIVPTQSQVRAVDNRLETPGLGVAQPLSAPPGLGAVQAAPPAAPASLGIMRQGNSFSGMDVGGAPRLGLVGAAGVGTEDRVAQLNRDADASRSLSARALERTQQGWSGPTPGLGVIGPRDYANRNQDFNAQAEMRTAIAKNDPLAVRAIGAGMEMRQEAALGATRQAAETQRAQLQEQGLAARGMRQDAQQAQSNAIAQQRLSLQQQQNQDSNSIDKARLGIEAGKANLAANEKGIQQGKDTQDIFSILDQAGPLLAKATNSFVGAGVDKLAQGFGASTKGAEAGAQLKALQGSLVSKMPKMSGPQSDKDVLLYREMAGQIGDATIPRETRAAAMQTIRQLNEKYLPAPTDQAAYAALAPGSAYKGPDGKTRRKP